MSFFSLFFSISLVLFFLLPNEIDQRCLLTLELLIARPYALGKPFASDELEQLIASMFDEE